MKILAMGLLPLLTGYGLAGQSVTPFVLRVPCVPLDPMEGDSMTADQSIELVPEVLILHRQETLSTLSLPVVLLPGGKPFGHSPLQIRGVGEQIHNGWFLQYLERFNRRGKFHPVVGCLAFATRDFLAMRATDENCSPAPRSRVPAAGAIGIDHHFLHGE